MPALVRALKRVDLPTFGSPTMPHFKLFLSEEGFQKAGLLGRLLGRFLDRRLLLRLLGGLGLLHRRLLFGMKLVYRALPVAGADLRHERPRAPDPRVDCRA